MRFCFLSVFAGLLIAVGASGDAQAKYSLCNKTSYTLSSAIGYVDGDRLATRGWWRLRPGQCKVVLPETTTPGRYFIYAEGIPGHHGPLRTWSGDTPLCVENSGFFNLRNQEVCRDDPSAQRDFFFVEVTPAADGDWQTDFAEASNFTVYSAEVAGVQRLLRDNGKSIGRIDGSLGRETRRVLAAYRKEKGLAENATIDDDLIDQLIADANARESKLGFFFCNKAGEAVWSAIAAPSGEETYESRGWWKLESGACAKVLKGELAHDHYYVYGVIEGARGAEKRLAGGDKSLCVNAVKFTAANDAPCSDQDYDEAMFKRIEIGGATSTTFDFLPDMFVSPPSE
ncbi:MAG: DUF1036 domain-containing protein [Pseudomonadota bacterium]